MGKSKSMNKQKLPLTWTCQICGSERADQFIAVGSIDLSAAHDLPEGTIRRNLRHCNDRQACILAAQEQLGRELRDAGQ